MRCGWSIRVAWKQLVKHIGLVYRWVATFIYTKYSNPDNPEAYTYDFVTNPLAYIGHQDQLPEAREVAAAAYTLRAI
jgi:hypothetical protein